MIVSFSATLSLFGAGILGKKNEYVSQHTIENCSACVNVHKSRTYQLSRSVINNDLSHLGGYIYSTGLVKAVSESLQELVRASSLSMLVNLNHV